MKISLSINGEKHEADIEPRLLLVHFIRDLAGLTGTHIGCETSLCGACTVLIDGEAVKSMHNLGGAGAGAEITTIEGLAQNGKLHPLQEAFRECHGLQCGFCTPGMIMAACGLLTDNSNPSEDEVRHGLEGNLCRCTGYQHIIDSVLHAAKNRKAQAAD